MTDYYTSIESCKPCKPPRLPLGTEKTHTTENTLKSTSAKTPAKVWKCVLCDITLLARCRDAHEASKGHMKQRDIIRVKLVLIGEEVDGQTPPVYCMKKKKKKKKKNCAKDAGDAGAQTPASVIPLSISPKKLPKPRQSAPTKNGRGKRDRARTKVAKNINVERTVVNGTPVIRILSAVPAPARIAVPKIEHPPVERTWRTWLSERQERYGYAYSLKQEWWTCPGCKCTMYETCKGVHELKKCKPMDLVEFVVASKRKGAGIMPVDVSRKLQKLYNSEEQATQKERYLRRAKERREKERKDKERRDQEMKMREEEMKMREEEMKMREEEEMKLQGRGGRSRGNKSRGNRRGKARGHGGS